MTLPLARPAGAPPARRDRSRHRVLGLLVALGVLLLVVLLSLALGARDVPLGSVFDAVFAPTAGNTDHLVVRDLRVPRTVVGIVAGACLGLAGAIMQGITRNPIADPGLLGVNAGASLCVVLAISFLGITAPAGYIWFALAGAAIAASVVYGIGAIGREGATPVKLALAGTALTAGLTSIITLLLITDVDTLGTYRFWSVGSLANRDLATVQALLPFVLAGVVLALAVGRMLNLLALGDDLARGLGQNIAVSRLVSGLAIVLLCGSATALAGPIVFVGLVVPHLVRSFTGTDYRWILAYSAVLGPALLLAADVIGRLVVRPGELEASLVVALVGAPVMIALVRRVKLAGL
ncbi:MULTISPECIES: iron chelate uptake ABC transporter family permease subunit [unclassified Salinibacterium]|uniref:FecCD family ABC transporter permease n=1 Tax=unclassified Salinibacterium TaxID=2632331 RepID=UPI00141DC9A1|nr:MULTISPECIES: iron chelate uptake ABC transporter family permease subunit [unclassified Salinibacterium]